VGRHDVLRQARIMRALALVGDVPVPEVCFVDADDPPLFASALVPGVALDPVIDQNQTAVDPDEADARWDAAISVVAALHALEPARLELGREQPREPGEELEVWEATMRAARFADDPLAARLATAMRVDVPALRRKSIVHGDFRLGNILFEGRQLRAVIDWEIWSIGEPAVDLGWFVAFTDAGNFPGVGHDVAGTPTTGEVLSRYERHGGVLPPELPWFLALGCFKLAAIQAHNQRRHLDGRYHDPYQELLGPSIARLLGAGVEHLAG
jgi:aminoglycoside phosphotransferase (APT) family kinase protein